MASPSEDLQLQNRSSENEFPRQEPATSVVVEEKAEAGQVDSAGEGGGDPKHDSEYNYKPPRSEGATQATEFSQRDVVIKRDKCDHPDAAVPPLDPSAEENPQSELRMDEGEITLTMGELLNDELQDLDPVDSQDNSQWNQIPFQDSATAELINTITDADEQGQPRQRILAFAARRFASAIQRNPEDYDALYNWALILQESADRVDPDSTSPSKDALLEEACKRYEEATRLCPTLNDATQHYEKAVQLNWNSPQALNNWGLALQELSSIVPAKKKVYIISTTISKFRAAIRLQFDFHRAIYNLGTVLYGLAEDTLRVGVPDSVKEALANDLYSQCAIYIAAAHALRPSNSVYRSALRLVRSMLPSPFLKVGFFTAPPIGNPTSPHREWKHAKFVLNHEGLYQMTPDEKTNGTLPNDDANLTKQSVKVEISDIVSVSASSDLSLPPGAGLCIDTINGPIYLVADSWESLDGWLDALRLVYTIFAKGKTDFLAGILAG
ncbi:hypothetical protein V2J09_020120 [Rumex salicifolius]